MIALLVLFLWLSIFCLLSKPLQISTSELQLKYFFSTFDIDVVLLNDSDIHKDAILDNVVLKFMPWIRKIHIQTNVNPNPISQDRIILFKQDLLHYCLTSPILTQHFIVIESGFTITNYLFPSQFFINEQPIIRMKNNVFGMTRTIFNENSFYKVDKSHQVLFAFKHAIKNRKILYKSHPLIHVKETVNYTMKEMFDSIPPIQTAIFVSDSYLKDTNRNDVQQIWVILIKNIEYSYQRLHFFQRVYSTNGTIIEIIPEKNLENVIVEIISKIKANTKHKPKFVFGPKESGIANNLANKISQVYDIGCSILEQPHDNDGEYNLRLNLVQK
jgi:hypothetical protein